MKLFLAILFSILVCSVAIAQNDNPTIKIEALQITTASSAEGTTAQVNTWKQQTQQQPQDAGAWLNYYNWLDRSKEIDLPEKKSQLNSIVASSGKYIAGSWQYALMLFLQSGKRDSASLFTAMDRSADKKTLYPYAIQYAAIQHDEKKLMEYCSALNDAAPLSTSLQEYHRNVLMSAEKNADIYAKGLHDLVPMLVLQQVYQVRRDIHLRYYEDEVIETGNTYLCLSLGQDLLQKFPDAGYTGLLVKAGDKTSFPELEKHLLHFSLSYLQTATGLPADEKLIYRNYLPSIILLYKNYKTKNDPKADRWKQILLKLAEMTETGETINKIIAP